MKYFFILLLTTILLLLTSEFSLVECKVEFRTKDDSSDFSSERSEDGSVDNGHSNSNRVATIIYIVEYACATIAFVAIFLIRRRIVMRKSVDSLSVERTGNSRKSYVQMSESNDSYGNDVKNFFETKLDPFHLFAQIALLSVISWSLFYAFYEASVIWIGLFILPLLLFLSLSMTGVGCKLEVDDEGRVNEIVLFRATWMSSHIKIDSLEKVEENTCYYGLLGMRLASSFTEHVAMYMKKGGCFSPVVVSPLHAYHFRMVLNSAIAENSAVRL